MRKFDKLFNCYLLEFNVEDRNDPAFYDYVVVFLQQLLQRNLIDSKAGDVRKIATDIVKDGYYNFIDTANNLSFKISFLFNSAEKDVNNLTVQIQNLIKRDEKPQTITNTHEESSISEIVNFLNTKKQEAETQKLQQQQAGIEVPAAVGETPAELPGAVPVQDTSKYMSGVK
jgi:hypothetical protein